MKSVKMVIAVGVAFLSVGLSNQAYAFNPSVKTVGVAPQTFFGGEVQESTVSVAGSTTGIYDFEPGIPAVFQTYEIDLSTGTNDGTSYGLSETHVVQTKVKIIAGELTKVATISQDVTITQISNNQFQVDVAPSKTVTVNLGTEGFLDLTGYAAQFQMQGNSGAGSTMSMRFFLHSEASAVDGSVAGVKLKTISCQNKTSGQTVDATVDGNYASWDCEAAGLLVQPQDQIVEKLNGIAY
ncbi:hypothetical protein [Hydrocarboniphaga sp.]|uniref:hypothetical protein n=1 Tax=Hydrocarboniphaga sp. TaxID=2033016 RepID=UPI002618104B|nr:hypothetical protein [Hydrocarboniphaga sp.]